MHAAGTHPPRPGLPVRLASARISSSATWPAFGPPPLSRVECFAGTRELDGPSEDRKIFVSWTLCGALFCGAFFFSRTFRVLGQQEIVRGRRRRNARLQPSSRMDTPVNFGNETRMRLPSFYGVPPIGMLFGVNLATSAWPGRTYLSPMDDTHGRFKPEHRSQKSVGCYLHAVWHKRWSMCLMCLLYTPNKESRGERYGTKTRIV